MGHPTAAFPIVRSLSLVCAALALLAGSGCSDEKSQAAGAPPPTTVDVAKPIVREIVEDDEFVGRFEATDRVEIRSRVDGYLAEIHFKDGSLVKKGDLLFTIDQRPFESRVQEVQAAVNSAQALVDFTKEDLDRADKLSKSGNISQQIIDERRQQYQVAEAQLAAAKAELIGAQLDLEFTEIRAPLSGRIDEKRLSVGNVVRANETLLTTVVSQDPIYFYFDIDERSYLAYARDARTKGLVLQEGSGTVPITVQLADERETLRQGHLDFSQNELDDQTGTMRIRALMDNADGVLQPGLFGRVNVPGSLPYQGVLIPDEAIAADQERRIVYVIDDKGLVSVKVIRPGPRIDGYRVVRSGLTGDETIVINGLIKVRPGITVKPNLVELPPNNG